MTNPRQDAPPLIIGRSVKVMPMALVYLRSEIALSTCNSLVTLKTPVAVLARCRLYPYLPGSPQCRTE